MGVSHPQGQPSTGECCQEQVRICVLCSQVTDDLWFIRPGRYVLKRHQRCTGQRTRHPEGVRTKIGYILLVAVLALLWYLVLPKKACFTVVLKSGVSYEGHVRYRGARDDEAIKAEIIDRIRLDTPDDDIAKVYLG